MSTLKVDTIKDTSGVEVYTAKAWVNFNGTGTVAIRASGNVSSITDNGTGDYTLNFTNAMPDANYANLATCTQGATGYIATGGTRATTTCGVKTFGQAGSSADATDVHFTVFR